MIMCSVIARITPKRYWTVLKSHSLIKPPDSVSHLGKIDHDSQDIKASPEFVCLCAPCHLDLKFRLALILYTPADSA